MPNKIFAVCLLLATSAAQAVEFAKEPLETVHKNVAEKKAVLIDVRSKDEWDKGHVEGAIFLPITTLEKTEPAKLAKILPKKKILYTHCAIGMRAEAAAEILAKQGYEVRPLKSDYKRLIEAGFQKHEPRVPSPASP